MLCLRSSVIKYEGMLSAYRRFSEHLHWSVHPFSAASSSLHSRLLHHQRFAGLVCKYCANILQIFAQVLKDSVLGRSWCFWAHSGVLRRNGKGVGVRRSKGGCREEGLGWWEFRPRSNLFRLRCPSDWAPLAQSCERFLFTNIPSPHMYLNPSEDSSNRIIP